MAPTPSAPPPPPRQSSNENTPSSSGPEVEAELTAADPQSLSIESIGVREELVGLGIAADGSLEVPDDAGTAGWYSGVGQLGGPGPVVLVGHVDSFEGPGVFYRLGSLKAGDEVVLNDATGGEHRYTVSRVESYLKEELPTTEVFGATLEDEIRLVTCSGRFDRDLRSYTENTVVYAAASA